MDTPVGLLGLDEGGGAGLRGRGGSIGQGLQGRGVAVGDRGHTATAHPGLRLVPIGLESNRWSSEVLKIKRFRYSIPLLEH